ncbi:short-chain dehydrogenase [Periconia macrospinosa]|uniref:Short-chain dehydrogenase n=1 Tax=Periconia macrospinosa TaxID=97972 RepID=A0A2V1DC23_9PLEO|nr:short-chain dehydrogenase [Periconia macrospinosa]
MSVSGLDIFRQSFFVPKPTFTESDVPDQTNKIHIVTGGYSGCGLELVHILYSQNATIYIAGRNPLKAQAAIERLQTAHPASKGRLEFLKLDLSDLSTIKASAEEFMAKEDRLHVLTNNAGVNSTPLEQKTPQGFDMQLSTNCLGPLLFTFLLLPVLRRTVPSEPPATVRVTWAASLGVEVGVGEEGIAMAENGTPQLGQNTEENYAMTKAGNLFYGVEFAKNFGKEGIVSVSFNPGNLRTEILRHYPPMKRSIMTSLFHPPKLGAYTELFSALSPEIDLSQNGAYIIPWGRIGGVNKLRNAIKPKEDGNTQTGRSELFWDWSTKEIQKYM